MDPLTQVHRRRNPPGCPKILYPEFRAARRIDLCIHESLCSSGIKEKSVDGREELNPLFEQSF